MKQRLLGNHITKGGEVMGDVSADTENLLWLLREAAKPAGFMPHTASVGEYATARAGDGLLVAVNHGTTFVITDAGRKEMARLDARERWGKWRWQKDVGHFHGPQIFGYFHRCIDEPRLQAVDTYYRRTRTTSRHWLIDGKERHDSLDDALAALAVPPVVTDEELARLRLLPLHGYCARPDKRAGWISLIDKGLAAWGPSPAEAIRLTDAGRALIEPKPPAAAS